MRLTSTIKKQKNDEEETDKPEEMDPMVEATKNMNYIMPVMSVSIALIAPLGLALYWLVNNLVMITEKLLMNKFLKTEGEENA